MIFKKINKLALITFTLMTYSQGAQVSEKNKEQTIEILYQKALDLRDRKDSIDTLENTQNQAESLFLELSNQGHVKAMHNYALIQYGKKNYDLAYNWFQKANLDASKRNCEKMIKEGKIKEDLYLVVGSDRCNIGSFCEKIEAIYGENLTDLSHLKTFDGKATTMDLVKSKLLKAKHIIGDATTFDFAAKYNVISVLLERLPTIEDQANFGTKGTPQTMAHLAGNYTGRCIEQISKAMKSGSNMQIEWHPYSTLANIDQSEIEDLITKNPFHGFFPMNVALQGTFILGGDLQNINILPKELVQPTLKMASKMKTYLEFYHQQGSGKSVDELIRQVYWEAYVILYIIQNQSLVLLNYSPFNDTVLQLQKAVQEALYADYPAHLIGKKIEQKDKSGNKICGTVYDLSSFQTSTLFNFLIDDMAAENNSPHVKKYVESIGFKEIIIEKKTNPHTGRKNVWMINAIKS